MGTLKKQIAANLIGVMISSGVLTGCLNQVGLKKTNKASAIFSIRDTETSGPEIIAKVVRTQTTPTISVDLIGRAALSASNTLTAGDSSHGELGSLCAPKSGTAAGCTCVVRGTMIPECPRTQDPTTCNRTELPIEERYTPLYYEADLVRCPIPTSINTNTIKFSLERTGTNEVSNTYTFTVAPSLSYDDPQFYFEVQRYACRWSPFVSHMMDESMIDPVQSDSPEATMTLLFYSTNLGLAMSQFAQQTGDGQKYFQCPPHLDPSKASMALRFANEHDFTPISDNSGKPISDDSVNFLLAKSPSGPFQNQLKLPQAPGGDAQPLGYAADPVSNSCPDASVKIPQGMEWRKLWLFRSSKTKRLTYSVDRFKQFQMICDPGALQGTTQVSTIKESGVEMTLRGNNFFSFFDCGRKAFFPSASPYLDKGTECKDPLTQVLYSKGDLTQSRVVLPIHVSGGSSSSVDDHRCVAIDDNGLQWTDRCTISQNSCSQNGRNPLTDSLQMCAAEKGVTGNEQLRTVYKAALNEVATYEIPGTPIEYLFVTTNKDQSPSGTLERPRFNDASGDFIKNPSKDQPLEQYEKVQNLNGVRFPLCVLRKTGGGS